MIFEENIYWEQWIDHGIPVHIGLLMIMLEHVHIFVYGDAHHAMYAYLLKTFYYSNFNVLKKTALPFYTDLKLNFLCKIKSIIMKRINWEHSDLINW